MLPSFYPTSKKAYVKLMVGRKVEGTPVPHMLLSQRPDPKKKTSHNPWSRCACVSIFQWIVYELLFMNRPFLFSFFGHGRSLCFEIAGPSCVQPLFFEYLDLRVSNFFSSCFLEHVFYFFFFNSPRPFSWNDNLEKVVMNNMEFYFVGWIDGWNVLAQLPV